MRRNKEALVRIILMITMIFLCMALMGTGSVKRFVHPRMNKYIVISILLLFTMLFFELPQLRKVKHRHHMMRLWVIGLPLFMICIMMNIEVPTAIKKTQYAAIMEADNKKSEKQVNQSAISSSNQVQEQDVEEEITKETVLQTKNEMRYINQEMIQDEDFANWLIEVYNHLNDYAGKTVTFRAQVLYDETLNEDELIAVRGVMTCCIADIGYYGFVCKGIDPTLYQTSQWIWVTGTFEIEEGENQDDMVLTNVQITPCDAPAEEYVYFY